MSGTCATARFFLRRCVALRRPPGLTAAAGTSCGSVPGSVIQRRTWSSETRTELLWTRTDCLWTRTDRLRTLCQPAVTSGQPRFCTKAGPPCEEENEEYPPLPAYQPQPQPETKEVYIVHVKGLPWSCTEQELLHFFSECRIRDGEKGVHLTLDRRGRPSGQAFIELEHEEDVVKALGKDRQYLGPRYVEVYEVTNSDAEAILKDANEARGNDGVVLLRGLPYSCTEDEILHFFSGLDIKENGITIVTDYRGRNSGKAFVQFSSQEDADKALQKHRELIGHRYIEVFSSSRDSIRSSAREKLPSSGPPLQPRRRAASDSQSDSRSPASVPPRSDGTNVQTHFLHLRGLPFQVSVEEIVEFFSPLVVSKVVVECAPNGRLNGEADVYFSCHTDAIAAMSKDRMTIGNRYIELFLNSEPNSD
ncbi:G-rich sequence factor 1 [Kryptolebias marmoratus]|uniref:G-rich RNA sequence binding factor 1 n=1 Tax=Kryptolebias marmoratus TaxID=37003 RepID=A0A3Q2ZS50_KRYMA|nr:G-rich sequence factor 1 [Kryptolebias marmoratus]